MSEIPLKQIDIIRTYSQKRCLVIDDVPEIRTSLKRILVDFGSTSIDTAGNAEEAIDLCQRHQYDIVLADFNLGNGKNGQQLLEELRFHRLLKNTAIYIVITADSAIHTVIHALEFQPDDYVNKPINRDSLRPRLDHALLRNEALLRAKSALDRNKPKQAIAACEEALAKNDRFSPDARKMLGELLIKQHQYLEAFNLYKDASSDRRPLWCSLGLAHALVGLEEVTQAETLLLKIVRENPMCVEAHDLLAQVYEASKKLAQAQHSLTNAIKISPRSAPRQREMGRISHEVGDNHAAVHAYRSTLKYSKNSCHEQAEDYLNLAQGLTNLARSKPGSAAATLTTEALETIKSVERRYANQPVVQMRSKLITADICTLADHLDDAAEATQTAATINNEMKLSAVSNTSSQLCIDCAKAFMSLGLYDEGERLLQELASINDDPKLAIKIDKLLREPITREGVIIAAKLNRQGIELYQQQKYADAVEAFEEVLRELPNHIGLNLNMIQAIISKNKDTHPSAKELQTVAGSFQRMGQIPSDSNYAGRHDYLYRHYEKLLESNTAENVPDTL